MSSYHHRYIVYYVTFHIRWPELNFYLKITYKVSKHTLNHDTHYFPPSIPLILSAITIQLYATIISPIDTS